MICPFCKKEWTSTIRSNPQNRYYWGVVIDILSNHTGFDPVDMHEILKHKFLDRNVVIADEVMRIPKSTTSLTTSEFEIYLSQIKEWASIGLSVVLPDPNEEIK